MERQIVDSPTLRALSLLFVSGSFHIQVVIEQDQLPPYIPLPRYMEIKRWQLELNGVMDGYK